MVTSLAAGTIRDVQGSDLGHLHPTDIYAIELAELLDSILARSPTSTKAHSSSGSKGEEETIYEEFGQKMETGLARETYACRYCPL